MNLCQFEFAPIHPIFQSSNTATDQDQFPSNTQGPSSSDPSVLTAVGKMEPLYRLPLRKMKTMYRFPLRNLESVYRFPLRNLESMYRLPLSNLESMYRLPLRNLESTMRFYSLWCSCSLSSSLMVDSHRRHRISELVTTLFRNSIVGSDITNLMICFILSSICVGISAPRPSVTPEGGGVWLVYIHDVACGFSLEGQVSTSVAHDTP